MRSTISLFFSLIAFVAVLSAQSSLEEKALYYHTKADTTWKNVDTCLKYTLLAIPLLKEIEDWEKYVYDLNGLSYCYTQKNDFETMLVNNELAYKEAKKYLTPAHEEFQNSMNNLGLAYKLNERYEEALAMYFDGLAYAEGANYFPRTVASLHENISNYYSVQSEYELSIKHSKLALEHFKKLNSKSAESFRTSKVLENIGLNHLNLNMIDEAEKYLLRAIEVSDLIKGENENHKASTRLAMVDFLIDQKRFGEVEPFMIAVEDFQNKSNLLVAYYHQAYGNFYAEQGMYKKAIDAYMQYFEMLPKELRIYRSRSLRKIGELYAKVGNEDMFRESFEESLELLDYDLAEIHHQEQYDWNYDFVRSLFELHKQLKDDNLLMESLEKVEENLNLSTKVLAGLTTQSVIDLYLAKIKAFNSLSLEVMWKMSKNEDYNFDFSLLFQIIENGKSIMLASEVWKKSKSAIEDVEYLNEIRKNRIQINQISIKLRNPQKLDSVQRKNLQDSLFKYQVENKKSQERVRKEHPGYSKWLYNEPIEIETIDRQLAHTGIGYINYHWYDDVLYYLWSEDGNHRFEKREVPSLKTKIDEWKSLMKFQSGEEQARWKEMGDSLKAMLIPNKLESKKIMISPDGPLFEFPFSALPASHDSDKNYWIEKCDIRNVYSFNAWALLNGQRKAVQKSLVVSDDELNFDNNLKKQLIEQLEDFSKVNEFEGMKTSEAFLASLSDHQLLHVSSHGLEYDSILKEPALVFKNFKIGLSDIDNIDLETQIVGLAACETALGEQSPVEGTQSIMRQFKAQSVPTVLSTLWKVNANSTDQIFNSFYGYAGEGEELGFALSQAKRDYLKHAPDFQRSPYYWAGIQLYGSIVPINTRSNYWFIGLGLIFLMALFLIFPKKNILKR